MKLLELEGDIADFKQKLEAWLQTAEVEEIRKMAKIVQHSDSLIKQLPKQAGKAGGTRRSKVAADRKKAKITGRTAGEGEQKEMF